MRRLAAVFTFSLLAGISTPALADLTPEPPPKEEESDGCSTAGEEAALFGLAALALLISGAALRRRDRS